MKSYKNALVLSGGSIKGAFQAGAISVALQYFEPDAIYGISVGSLNSTFLTDRAATMKRPDGKPDWPAIGNALVEFWKKNIHGANDIAKQRGFLGIGFGFLMKNWDGLSDTKPLRDLVKREVDINRLRQSPVYLAVGATNLNSGDIEYADLENSPDRFLEYVIASTAIPFMMPQVTMPKKNKDAGGEDVFVDGAGRDSSPIGKAIEMGAETVLGIYCHPEKMDMKPALEHRRFGIYAQRVMDIISSEQIRNDHKIGVMINQLIQKGAPVADGFPLAGKRYIRGLSKVIRPEAEIPYQIDEINPAIIAKMIDDGKRAAEKFLSVGGEDMPVSMANHGIAHS